MTDTGVGVDIFIEDLDAVSGHNAVRPHVDATAPGQVTGLLATPGDSEVALAWAAPSDGGAAITDYLIETSVHAADTWSPFAHGDNTTAATVTGLTNATSYDFRVSAINEAGTGPASAVVSATPAGATVITNDAFARADNASSMGSTPQGQVWLYPDAVTASALAGITGGQAYFSTIGDGMTAVVLVDAGVADCTVGADLPVVMANQGLQVRATNADNGVLVAVVGTALEVYEVVSGNYTKISGTSGDGADIQDGDRIDVVLAGTSVAVLKNDAELYTVTSSVGLTRTKHGLRGDGTSLDSRFDNFKITVP